MMYSLPPNPRPKQTRRRQFHEAPSPYPICVALPCLLKIRKQPRKKRDRLAQTCL